MKKFFSKLFKSKSTENQSVLSFEILNEIYSYLYYENSSVNFKLKGFLIKFTSIAIIFQNHLIIQKVKAKLKVVVLPLFMKF